MQKIVQVVEDQLAKNRLPSVHPHHSMLYPLTQEQKRGIASRHASLCIEKVRMYALWLYNCIHVSDSKGGWDKSKRRESVYV